MKRLIFTLQIFLCLILTGLPVTGIAAGVDTLVIGVSTDIHTLDSASQATTMIGVKSIHVTTGW